MWKKIPFTYFTKKINLRIKHVKPHELLMTKFAFLFYITIKKAIVSRNESKPKSMLSCEHARKWIHVLKSIKKKDLYWYLQSL